MYLYDHELSGAESWANEQVLNQSSGNARFGAAERSKSTANQPMPQWLQAGVRQGRWKPETAEGLWALRKIAKG
jgi:hypothetical protein